MGRDSPTSLDVAVDWHLAQRCKEVPIPLLIGARRPNTLSSLRHSTSHTATPRSPRTTCAQGVVSQHFLPLPLFGISPSDAKKSPRDLCAWRVAAAQQIQPSPLIGILHSDAERSLRNFCAGRGGLTPSAVAISRHLAQQRQELPARLVPWARRHNNFSRGSRSVSRPVTPQSPRADSVQDDAAQHI